METAGGGGYGDSALRDPERLKADIADGKIGADGARESWSSSEQST